MFRGTLYLFTGQLVYAVSALVFHGFLGRKLGPEDYGVFGVINSMIVFIEVFFLRASYEGISKFVAADSGAVRSIINTGIKFQAFIGISVGFLLYCFSESIAGLLKDTSIAIYIKMIAILIPISALSFVYIGALNGMRTFWKQSKVLISFSSSRLIIVCLLIYLGFGLKGLMIGIIISGLIQLYFARRYCNPFTEKGVFNTKKLAGFVPQLILISLFSAIIMNIDILAIKAILRNDQLTGFYTSAITVTRIPSTFLTSLTMALFPFIAKSEAENDSDNINRLINRSSRYLLIFILPMTLVVSATSKELLVFIYGKPYAEASIVLKILIFGTMLHAIKVLMFNVIVASGRPRTVVVIGFVSLVIDVGLIFTLIGRYGIAGVATAVTITNCCGFILAITYIYHRYGTFIHISSFLRIMSASGFLYILATFIVKYGLPLPLNYLLLVIMYILALLAIKEIDDKDIESMKRIFIKYNISLTQRQ